DLLQAELLRERHVRGALEVVRRDDARVRPLSGRVVLVRLTRQGRLVREADVRVRRADVAEALAVGDRHLDLGAAGVERADDGDDGLVAGVRAGVRRALRRIPLARRGGRVVTGLVADRVLPGLPPAGLELEEDCL